jgi:hypothetical protein
VRTQPQATRYVEKMLSYNKPSLFTTVVLSATYVANILFLGSVLTAAFADATDKGMTKGIAYLVTLLIGSILFLSVTLINGLVKYFRNQH